jgi:hypothetical protein
MLGVGTAAQSMATTAAMEPIAVAPLPAAPAVAVSPMSPDPAALQAMLARSLNVQPVASSFAHTLAVGLSSSSVSRSDSVAAAEAGLRASTMAASPLRTFVSPTAFARRTEVSETRTLSPLATARAMPSASFRSLADSVFERLDAIEAALMRFDADSEADAEAAPQ